MRNNQHQQPLWGEGRLAAHDLMMQYLHCQRAMASWIPISRSNSFLKNVRHFTVGGNLLNFPWFLPWNPKESTQDVQHLNPQIWPCSSHCVYITIIFLTFLTHQKPKNHRVPFQVPQPPPQKNWASVFFPVQKKAHLEHHLSDFASAPPCSAPVPLPLESKVVVAPTLRPDVGPRAGRRWGGMWTGTRGFIT